MDRKLYFLSFVVLSIILIAFIWMVKPADAIQMHSDNSLGTLDSVRSVQNVEDNQIVENIKPKLADNGQCDLILEKSKEFRKTWLRQNRHQDWDQYLSKDYSELEIAYLIKYIQPGAWADSWLHKRRALKSKIAVERRTQKNKFKKILMTTMGIADPDNYMDELGIRIGVDIPQEQLEGFVELTAPEQLDVVNNIDVSIDDLAYFIGKRKISDDVLIAMLARLDTTDSIVYYDRPASTNILDHALFHGRPKLYMNLLGRGFEPTDDPIISGTPEYALIGLALMLWRSENQQRGTSDIQEVDLNQGQLAAQIEISKSLNKSGFSTFYSYDSDGERLTVGSRVNSGLGRMSFDNSQLDFLAEEFNFYPNQLNKKASPIYEDNNRLTKLIQSEYESKLKAHLSSNNYVFPKNGCLVN